MTKENGSKGEEGARKKTTQKKGKEKKNSDLGSHYWSQLSRVVVSASNALMSKITFFFFRMHVSDAIVSTRALTRNNTNVNCLHPLHGDSLQHLQAAVSTRLTPSPAQRARETRRGVTMNSSTINLINFTLSSFWVRCLQVSGNYHILTYTLT